MPSFLHSSLGLEKQTQGKGVVTNDKDNVTHEPRRPTRPELNPVSVA